ncbi:MAG: ATP/GTP-binding protein [Bacteroidetes bacterium]|nr:ATP/GTP-binding protein [Bacteroidota bacterium]
MKKIFPLMVSSVLIIFLCNVANAQHQLIKLWQTDSALKVPESALFNAANNFLYESNIDGDPWAKDGKGSIGKVGLDGRIIKVDWVSGLNAPKGMGLHKNKLYAADVDNVVVIDVAKEAISNRIPVEGASGLNDISVDANGIVYVTDSRIGKLYRIENDKASLYADNLNGINGVLCVGKDVYVVVSGSLLKISPDKKITKIASGMEPATDGLEQISDTEFLVSVWNGIIYYVNVNGTVEKLLDTRDQKSNTADIGYDAKKKIVYVPTFFRNSIAAYQLK